MHRKLLSLALVCLFIHTMVGVEEASAKTDAEKQARLAEKVKAGIFKLGVGKQSLVAVKMRDKRKLAGYISEMKEDSFVVIDFKTGASTNVAYTDVSQVKGNNLSKGAKIAIGVGIAVAVAILLVFWQIEASNN